MSVCTKNKYKQVHKYAHYTRKYHLDCSAYKSGNTIIAEILLNNLLYHQSLIIVSPRIIQHQQRAYEIKISYPLGEKGLTLCQNMQTFHTLIV